MAISETELIVTRVIALIKSSVERMKNVSVRLASIVNARKASSESLLTACVKIRTSVLPICTVVHKYLHVSTCQATTNATVKKDTPEEPVVISTSARLILISVMRNKSVQTMSEATVASVNRALV